MEPFFSAFLKLLFLRRTWTFCWRVLTGPECIGYAVVPGDDKKISRLFISYSRRNKAQVYPLAEALEKAGIKVWIDRDEIEPLGDFPERIRDGLPSSHALLAWYSAQYAQSSYCQKEPTAAWIYAHRLTRNVLSRIFVLNPEESVAHIALGDIGRPKNTLRPCLRIERKGPRKARSAKTYGNLLAYVQFASGSRAFKTFHTIILPVVQPEGNIFIFGYSCGAPTPIHVKNLMALSLITFLSFRYPTGVMAWTTSSSRL